jgi:hypothetical protein
MRTMNQRGNELTVDLVNKWEQNFSLQRANAESISTSAQSAKKILFLVIQAQIAVCIVA